MIFIISGHKGVDGVKLSRPGHWGNLPFASIEDAQHYAQGLARPAVARFEFKSYRAPRLIATA